MKIEKKLYRLMQEGCEIWRSRAFDTHELRDKFFKVWQGKPDSLERFTIQRFDQTHLSLPNKKHWFTVCENAHLPSL